MINNIFAVFLLTSLFLIAGLTHGKDVEIRLPTQMTSQIGVESTAVGGATTDRLPYSKRMRDLPTTLGQLTKQSDCIAVGEIKDVKESGEGRFWEKIVLVRVDEVLFGNCTTNAAQWPCSISKEELEVRTNEQSKFIFFVSTKYYSFPHAFAWDFTRVTGADIGHEEIAAGARSVVPCSTSMLSAVRGYVEQLRTANNRDPVAYARFLQDLRKSKDIIISEDAKDDLLLLLDYGGEGVVENVLKKVQLDDEILRAARLFRKLRERKPEASEDSQAADADGFESVVRSGGVRHVPAGNVEIIRLQDAGNESISNLWTRYTSASSGEMREVVARLMTARPSREMSPKIDNEVCVRFEAAPDSGLALLLGMCSSGKSMELLVAHEKSVSLELASAVSLGLARKGNAAAETAVVEEFLRQPVGRGEQVNWATDLASRKSIRNLEYIGSPRCILALSDAAFSIQARITNAESRATAPSLKFAANIREFLRSIDIAMPDKANGQEISDWWKLNRAKVSSRLNEKGDDLPRLRPMRAVISHD